MFAIRSLPWSRQMNQVPDSLLAFQCMFPDDDACAAWLIEMRWQDIDGDVLNLADSKTGHRTVYLSAPARAILERQPRSASVYVFPSPFDPERPLSPSLGLWRKVRKSAGIEDVRLHDLRHSFASHAVLQGIPLPVVSRLLGHKRPSMTLRYAHVGDRETEAP